MKIEQLKAYGPKALIVSFSSTDTPYKDVFASKILHVI